ncbi:uridine kinase [Mucilaginibacter gracilis]|uniref:beta-fructofuranosidase n=1 Tax=Mucilaginibacter gracilis TaxID=423350 RepID=A0A495IVM1_9SPHI|nr:glycoside hydrolase 100 family protein [Mucilaginibacter gracilis]RKR80795.1 uridine kinase [Mucilaginibacter gracilis]
MTLAAEDLNIEQRAIKVLKWASSTHGIKASSNGTDNYGYIWARDSAIAGLAILSNELTDLYQPLKSSLVRLQSASTKHGQIPSNILVTQQGEIQKVSFGGPVGRVDASFWWIISSVLYLQKLNDNIFKETVCRQCDAFFELANCWEFNGKGLMYVPMSSNWADEYVTSGYVLYDQLLRYWALTLAGNFFNRDDWEQKALEIKIRIKQHYLLEAELTDSLYTQAQQAKLKSFEIGENFIASFSPGSIIDRFDGWSMALLLLLDIPSKQTKDKIDKALKTVLNQTNNKGIPAFWPPITPDDELYKALLLNYGYNFKNKPGHFHNGGIWPVVNGFLVTGLTMSGFKSTANLLTDALNNEITNCITEKPFTEYFDFYTGEAGGVTNLCFSAAGYLLSALAQKDAAQLKSFLLPGYAETGSIIAKVKPNVQKVVGQIAFSDNKVVAISIAGESGSGKTTLSKIVRDILLEKGLKVIVLHQDDYFKLPPKQNHEARLKDFDHIGPHEVRLALLDEHIKKIKQLTSATLAVPYMDWVTDTEEVHHIDIEGTKVVLVDGTYTSLLNGVDHRIYINTTYQHTRKNRINRNRETVTSFIEKVLEKESSLIIAQQSAVDIVVDDKFMPLNNPNKLKTN